MRIMFAVQGEGRGHLTQALAMARMLSQAGHHLTRVLVGSNSNRSLPAYFEAGIAAPVTRIASPGFVFHQGRGVCPMRTVAGCLRHLAGYRRSLGLIEEEIRSAQPDLIFNFLEPLLGLYNLLRPHPIPVVAVGHQFMIGHPEFVHVPRRSAQYRVMRRYIDLVGARSTRLALSFYPARNLPQRRLIVSPPLLREGLHELRVQHGNFLLIYLLNHGYVADILDWSRRHPDVPIHCFCDRPGAPEAESVTSSLTLHRLSGVRFLEFMARSRAVVCTAGFETVSEAAYLGKSLLLVPVAQHVEQHLNALDAEHAGIAIHDTRFHLNRILNLSEPPPSAAFRRWVDGAASLVEDVVYSVGRSPRVLFGDQKAPAPEPAVALH